jgi:hypothetical protein
MRLLAAACGSDSAAMRGKGVGRGGCVGSSAVTCAPRPSSPVVRLLLTTCVTVLLFQLARLLPLAGAVDCDSDLSTTSCGNCWYHVSSSFFITGNTFCEQFSNHVCVNSNNDYSSSSPCVTFAIDDSCNSCTGPCVSFFAQCSYNTCVGLDLVGCMLGLLWRRQHDAHLGAGGRWHIHHVQLL